MERRPILLVYVVNFLLNMSIQGSIIFIPLLSAQLGASDFQVGLVGAAYGATYLVSSLHFGRQSDRLGRLAFIRIGLLLSAITLGGQLLTTNLLTLALFRASIGIALGITVPALLAYAFEAGADMGRFSSYGSLGWIGGALAGAWLISFQRLFLLSALSCVAALIFALLFPPPGRRSSRQESAASPGLGLVIKRGRIIYLSVFFRHLGATAVWIMLPLYFGSLGLGRFWVGMLWGINYAVQFVVMRYLERYKPQQIFAFGQVLSILVFLGYALLTGLWPLIGVQVLLGVAWSCLYVGALLLVLRTGEERGTATGIFQATLNLCNAVGPFLGGLIAQVWGYRGLMFFAAALGVAAMAVAIPKIEKKQAAA